MPIFCNFVGMKRHDYKISYEEHAPAELDELHAALCAEAMKATRGSYAPYSDFRVGAALRLLDGTLVKGANQENAAFPSGTCAERSAVFAAGANRPDTPITHLAIAARKGDGPFQDRPISPCGACRQALLEYERKQGSPIEVTLYGTEAVYVFPSVASLLPFSFTEF